MSLYYVRPYFGHDCDSVNGFNNGYYLKPIQIEAADEGTAIELAMNKYISEHAVDMTEVERDGHFGENTLYCEFDHDAETEEYRYAYIDFNEVSEVRK